MCDCICLVGVVVVANGLAIRITIICTLALMLSLIFLHCSLFQPHDAYGMFVRFFRHSVRIRYISCGTGLRFH